MNSPLPSSSAPDADAIYRQLAEGLRERLRVIADRESYQRDATAHLGQLQAASERVSVLQAQLPRPLDPKLAHYLERCSYDKALAWLEAADRSGRRHEM